jgi:hypothetical protein
MTTTTISVKTIAEDIKTTVRPLMVKWVDDRVAYLLNTREWMKSDETNAEVDAHYAQMKPLGGKYYMRSDARRSIYAGAGISKGDQQLIAYYGKDDWLKKTQKDAEAKLLKIDVAVAKKITYDVVDIQKLYAREGRDGYMEGAWKINDDQVFSFETFYAGGYNIQCLHVRTKYKLK